MQNIQPDPVATPIGVATSNADHLQLALKDIAKAAEEGLLAMAVATGMAVTHELMEEEVTALAGPKGAHNPSRVVYRHGHENGQVTLGARRVRIRRPRIRKKGGGEERIAAYEQFASRDLLGKGTLSRMLAGISTRRFTDASEPVGEEVEAAAVSTSKSAVSREFVARTRDAMRELMHRDLGDVRLAALMIDGLDLRGRTVVVALGVSTDGVKLPLGLWEGSTENATVATALLTDLTGRGLDPAQGMLFVIDGGKALKKAIRTVFGETARVQRCIRHKERNILDHLPEKERPKAKARMRAAWDLGDADEALQRLQKLQAELGFHYPGAAASLGEGMEETLTVQRLRVTGKLKATLQSTNPIESMISVVRTTSRNVKHWQSGDMGLRWTAAGMLEAEKKFRKVFGYKDLAKFVIAIEHELAGSEPASREEVQTLVTV